MEENILFICAAESAFQNFIRGCVVEFFVSDLICENF